MAIDVLRRQGKSAVTGILGKNARRIAGNIGSVIRGDVGSGESSDFAPINRNKQSTKMLSFPIDVGADPGIGNHGHYIMFMINEQQNTKLKFGDETQHINSLLSFINRNKCRNNYKVLHDVLPNQGQR